MKTINAHIKTGEFKPVYLLYGEERYLVEQFKNKLKTALSSDGDTMNLAVYNNDNLDINSIIDFANTMPFLAPKRVVIIEDSGLLKASNEQLATFLKNVPETTVIIFSEREVDKRNKVYKAIKDVGYVCEMNTLSLPDLKRWIEGLLKSYSKKINQDAYELLIYKVGTSMYTIVNELQKLVSYIGDRETITLNDVEEIASNVVTNKIFDMISAMSNKEQKVALDLYYDLLTLKEPPLRILFLIARQFNILLRIKEMSDRYVDEATMSKTLEMPSFIIKKNKLQSQNFSKKTLYNAVKTCVEIEERVKTGRMEDRLGVELVIVRFSN